MSKNAAKATPIRKLALGVLLIAVAALAAPAAPGASVQVLCYHAFLDRPDQYSFSVEALAGHIDQYQARGFRFVSLSDLAEGRLAGGNNILVTVDDGNRSFLAAWERVFKPRGIRPLLAIYPGAIVDRKPYAITWDELRALADDVDIAAHGWYHLRLDEKLYRGNRADFEREIKGSKKELEERLGRPVSVFVYAGGYRSDAAERVIREAGYRYAFTIEQGGIELPIEGRYNPLRLPRYMVTKGDARTVFERVARQYIRRPWTDGPAIATSRLKEAVRGDDAPLPPRQPRPAVTAAKPSAPGRPLPGTLAAVPAAEPIVLEMPALEGVTTAGDVRIYPDRGASPRSRLASPDRRRRDDPRTAATRDRGSRDGADALFDDGMPPAMIPVEANRASVAPAQELRPEPLGLAPEQLASFSPAALAAAPEGRGLSREERQDRVLRAGIVDDYRKQQSKIKDAYRAAITANRRSYEDYVVAVRKKLRRAVDSWSKALNR